MIFARLERTISLTLLASLFGIFGCLPFASTLAQEHCSPEMNDKAVSTLIDARENWRSLQMHQRKFAACDDGELGEGYSDAVVHLFASKWDQFGAFAAIAKTNAAFQRWAVRHIDATASDDDLKKIVLNANTCTDDVKVGNLCKIVWQSAENALAESARTQRQDGQ